MSSWTFDPPAAVGLLLSGALYAVGAARLLRHASGRGWRLWRPLAFAAGWTVLAIALLSPIATLSESLLSVHMTQHELLMVVAAPLLVLARPLGTFVWALPLRRRIAVGRWVTRPAVSGAWRVLTGAVTVWILHGAALWVWHAPPLYQAAVRDDRIHALMHVCFLFTATLFWWALIHGRYGRLGYGIGVLYVFLTGLHATALGALMTVAPRPWYALYRARGAAAGVDPLEDQQLAGLLMWVPFGIVFLVVGLALFAAWLGEAERRVAATAARPMGPGPGLPLRAVALLVLSVATAGLACSSESPERAAGWTGGEPSRGKTAIRRYGCSSCHTIPGVPGADGLVGPPLTHLASRTYIAGKLTNTPDNLRAFIAHPHAAERSIAMPEMGIPDQDARDICAYLYTLR
jgi:cytochrome c oxidase assembly factor CtaG/cytochrome c2